MRGKLKSRPDADKLTRPTFITINNRLSRDPEFAKEYLLEAGWAERDVPSPWRWYQKALPAAHYTLRDAVSLESSHGRSHSISRSSKP